MTRAEQIFTNGRFLTMDPRQPVAEALAVAQGRIIAVGAAGDVQMLAGPGTKTRDMAGQFIMPGLIESHTHALWGACRDLFEVYAGHGATLSTLADAFAKRAGETPAGTWLRGGPWRLDMMADLGTTPRAWLDRIAPNHPVAVTDFSQHAMWVNSLALQLTGLENAPDIPGGVIERDPSGAPTGLLAEAALAPVNNAMSWTAAQLGEATEYFQSYFHSLGYTGFKEPMADEETLSTYADALDAGRLDLHIAAHLVAYSPLSGELVPLDEVDRLRAEFARPELRLNYAKLFLDGVAPGHTASFLDPYLPQPGYDPAAHDPDATLLLPPAQLNRLVTDLDQRGYVVKMHAVGDNAARKGLDAIAAARAENGASGLRHEIAHSTFITDADLPRFADLGAVAEVSPKLWYPNPATPAQRSVLGDPRLACLHRLNTYQDHGIELIFGTDWPAAAPDAVPWTGLGGMLNRQDPEGRMAGTMNAEEALTLDAALPLFTVNSARAMGLEGEAGQLISGAWADFIVLPGDIRAMTPSEIGAIKVQETVFKGKTVHAL